MSEQPASPTLPPGRALEVRTTALGVLVTLWTLLRSLGGLGLGNAFAQGVVVFAAASLLGLAAHEVRRSDTTAGIVLQALVCALVAVVVLLVSVLLLLVVTDFDA